MLLIYSKHLFCCQATCVDQLQISSCDFAIPDGAVLFHEQPVKQGGSHLARPRRQRHDGRRYARIIQAHLLSYDRLCYDAARRCRGLDTHGFASAAGIQPSYRGYWTLQLSSRGGPGIDSEVAVERGVCERSQRQPFRNHAEPVGGGLLSGVKVRLINLPAWTGASGVRGILVSSVGRAHWLVSFARTKVLPARSVIVSVCHLHAISNPDGSFIRMPTSLQQKRAAVANLRTRHGWMWR